MQELAKPTICKEATFQVTSGWPGHGGRAQGPFGRPLPTSSPGSSASFTPLRGEQKAIVLAAGRKDLEVQVEEHGAPQGEEFQLSLPRGFLT